MSKRRIYWTAHNLITFAKGASAIIIIGVLSIPSAGLGPWVGGFIIGLLGLLALYSLYIFIAVFYIIEEDQLTVFAMWKFLHFKYSDIRQIEVVHGKPKTKYGWGMVWLKITVKNYEIFISPTHFLEFEERLREAKRVYTVSTITSGKRK